MGPDGDGVRRLVGCLKKCKREGESGLKKGVTQQKCKLKYD